MEAEGGIGRVELADRLADRDRSAHAALGVVLVGQRGAEEGHDRVADELLHGAAVALELGLQAGVVRRQHPAHVLGVELLGAAGEADEVGEEHRDDLALLEDRRLILAGLEGGPARGTEGQAESHDLAARPAGAPELEAAAPAEQRPGAVLEATRRTFGHDAN